MAQANRQPTTNPPAFLTAVARVHLSHLFRDRFVAAAFKTAEDDGLAPEGADLDHPPVLTGGAAELIPAAASSRWCVGGSHENNSGKCH